MKNTLNEVKANKAMTIVITNCYEKLVKEKINYYIELKSCGSLTPLLSILPFQMISLEICNILKRNID